MEGFLLPSTLFNLKFHSASEQPLYILYKSDHCRLFNNLILFHLGRPNFLIGKGGCKIDELKKELSESFENEIEILIVEDLVSTIPSKYNYTFDYNDYDDYN